MASSNPKIKQVRIDSTTTADIDLPSTAEPSITSLTTSGDVTADKVKTNEIKNPDNSYDVSISLENNMITLKHSTTSELYVDDTIINASLGHSGSYIEFSDDSDDNAQIFAEIYGDDQEVTIQAKHDFLEIVTTNEGESHSYKMRDKMTIDNNEVLHMGNISSQTDTTVTKDSTKLITSGAVWTAIDNLPEPMVFKGSLGTGGTITSLPVNGTANIGDTYKVITDGTYASKSAKVGDTFICDSKTSSANTWTLIPSGDEPSGTVTSVALRNGSTSQNTLDISGSPITSSGTIDITLKNAYGDTKNPYGNKNANKVLAGPTSGSATAPSFRSLVAGDIPDLSSIYSLTSHTHSLSSEISPSSMTGKVEYIKKVSFSGGVLTLATAYIKADNNS